MWQYEFVAWMEEFYPDIVKDIKGDCMLSTAIIHICTAVGMAVPAHGTLSEKVFIDMHDFIADKYKLGMIT